MVKLQTFYEYYQTLNKDPLETTWERVISRDEKLVPDDRNVCILGLVTQELSGEDYDIVFSQASTTPTNNSFYLKDSDGYFDIRVYGATFCKIPCKNGDDLEMVPSDDGTYLTFEDISYENPLFSICSLKDDDDKKRSPTMVTDGDKVEYKNFFMKICHLRESAYFNSHTILLPSIKKRLFLTANPAPDTYSYDLKTYFTPI